MAYDCLKAGLRWRISWLFVAIAMIIGASLGAGFISPLIYGLPTLKINARIISHNVPVGGVLKFLVISKGRPEKNCPATITRQFHFTVMLEGKLISDKWRDSVPGPIVAKEEDSYIMSVPLPGHAMPGEWFFQGRIISNCGFLAGGEQYIDTPIMKFKVVEKEH